MPNGIIVTKDRMYAFIGKYELDNMINLDCKIDRPLTMYKDGERVVCWYNDNSCGKGNIDPDKKGRDYYIEESLINFKTKTEKMQEVRDEAITAFPMEMTAFVNFEEALLLVKQSVNGETYVKSFSNLIRQTHEKLFPIPAPVVKKTTRKAPARKKVPANKKKAPANKKR
jgi:hypothetical protein